jgi:general secretion pathway protein K
MLKMVLDHFKLEETEKNIIIDSIMDWRDKDNFHRMNGAENDYYLSLPEPYPCKNGDFTSVGELLLVRGVTPKLFHGGLKDMVSVYQDKETVLGSSTLSRTWAADSGRININAASPKMLRALPRMTDDLVRDIMKYREKKDFESLSDLHGVVGAEAYMAISPYITMSLSPYYTIRSVGMLPDSQVRQGVQAVVKIDRTLVKGYKIIQWIDGTEYQSQQGG